MKYQNPNEIFNRVSKILLEAEVLSWAIWELPVDTLPPRGQKLPLQAPFSVQGELGLFLDPLEKRMATHSGIIAWRSPWIEETGELQSVSSQRVGHD